MASAPPPPSAGRGGGGPIEANTCESVARCDSVSAVTIPRHEVMGRAVVKPSASLAEVCLALSFGAGVEAKKVATAASVSRRTLAAVGGNGSSCGCFCGPSTSEEERTKGGGLPPLLAAAAVATPPPPRCHAFRCLFCCSIAASLSAMSLASRSSIGATAAAAARR